MFIIDFRNSVNIHNHWMNSSPDDAKTPLEDQIGFALDKYFAGN